MSQVKILLIVAIQFQSERVAFEDLIWPFISKLPVIATELFNPRRKNIVAEWKPPQCSLYWSAQKNRDEPERTGSTKQNNPIKISFGNRLVGIFIKGSSHPSNSIFEINVGKRRIDPRIRHTTTLILILQSIIQFKSRPMSDPSLSDIDIKN